MALINFDAGPAALPQEVLEQAAAAVLNYKDSGLSLLEIPHRGPLFKSIIDEANELALELLNLSGEEYQALWLQGGGRLQFSMIPMNFLGEGETAAYLESGHWASQAIKAADLYGNVEIAASSRADNYACIPKWDEPAGKEWQYLYLTSNNTIFGTQYHTFPETGGTPLFADMSSELFSRDIDYSRFSLIFAVAQKNIGPAGVTLVVIKKSLLERQKRPLPDLLSYREMAKHNSLLNTPPVFAIYTSLLTLRWVKKQGIKALDAINKEKARLLYEAIDNSQLFYGVAQAESRSVMNVCFRAYDESHTEPFIAFAKEKGIVGIKGHRSVGGFRASLYNAISLEKVQKLVSVIQEYEVR